MGNVRYRGALVVLAALAFGACGEEEEGTVDTAPPTEAPPPATEAPVASPAPVETEAPVATDPLPTDPPPTTAPPTTAAPETTTPPTTDPPAPPLDTTGELWTLDWSQVNPTYLPNTGPASDPFFHIHTSNELDGFYLSFEMFTIWGQAWTGETGDFEISCLDQASDTGICVHFDPDGPGPMGDIAADFGATGEVTITALDDGMYDVSVHSLRFTDGTEFAPFDMTG